MDTSLTEDTLMSYIRNRRCFCCFCADLQKKVLKEGLKAIGEYKGMICSGVEDMIIRYGRLG